AVVVWIGPGRLRLGSKSPSLYIRHRLVCASDDSHNRHSTQRLAERAQSLPGLDRKSTCRRCPRVGPVTLAYQGATTTPAGPDRRGEPRMFPGSGTLRHDLPTERTLSGSGVTLVRHG